MNCSRFFILPILAASLFYSTGAFADEIEENTAPQDIVNIRGGTTMDDKSNASAGVTVRGEIGELPAFGFELNGNVLINTHGTTRAEKAPEANVNADVYFGAGWKSRGRKSPDWDFGANSRVIAGLVLSYDFQRQVAMDKDQAHLVGIGVGAQGASDIGQYKVKSGFQAGRLVTNSGEKRAVIQAHDQASGEICIPSKHSLCLELSEESYAGWLQVGATVGAGVSYRYKISDSPRSFMNMVKVGVGATATLEFDRDGFDSEGRAMAGVEIR